MSNPADVMDDINVLEKDKCAVETGTKKRSYSQTQTVDNILPKRARSTTKTYNLSNIPENYDIKCKTTMCCAMLSADGKLWRQICLKYAKYPPTKLVMYQSGFGFRPLKYAKYHYKFIKAKKLDSESETNNSLQVIIEHLTGKQLPAAEVCMAEFPGYMKKYAGDHFHLHELTLFSTERNMTCFGKDCPDTLRRKFEKIEAHNLFNRGSGIFIVRFSTNNGKDRRSFCVINLCSSYLYAGGDQFLPFNKSMVKDKESRQALLKSFGIQQITEVYLLTCNKGCRAGSYQGTKPMTLYDGINTT